MNLDSRVNRDSFRNSVVIDVEEIYRTRGDTARLANLKAYEQEALRQAGRGNDIVLTGRGPIWLYLRLAHALHGVARKLVYRSGPGDDVVIFDHTVR